MPNQVMPGFNEVLKLMQQLPDAVNVKVLRSAERSALGPVNRTMRKLVDSRTTARTGRYRGSIGIKLLKSNSPFTVATLAGSRYGGKLGAPHAHLIEKGTAERKLKKPRLVTFVAKDGKRITGMVSRTGKMEARNIMRDAISAHETQVKNDMERQVLASLDRYMKRLNKKFK